MNSQCLRFANLVKVFSDCFEWTVHRGQDVKLPTDIVRDPFGIDTRRGLWAMTRSHVLLCFTKLPPENTRVWPFRKGLPCAVVGQRWPQERAWRMFNRSNFQWWPYLVGCCCWERWTWYDLIAKSEWMRQTHCSAMASTCKCSKGVPYTSCQWSPEDWHSSHLGHRLLAPSDQTVSTDLSKQSADSISKSYMLVVFYFCTGEFIALKVTSLCQFQLYLDIWFWTYFWQTNYRVYFVCRNFQCSVSIPEETLA